jgi:hypothetical protein
MCCLCHVIPRSHERLNIVAAIISSLFSIPNPHVTSFSLYPPNTWLSTLRFLVPSSQPSIKDADLHPKQDYPKRSKSNNNARPTHTSRTGSKQANISTPSLLHVMLPPHANGQIIKHRRNYLSTPHDWILHLTWVLLLQNLVV